MSQGEIRKRFSTGAISATVWKNTDKEQKVYHSVSFERSYKDKTGNWKTTKCLRVTDLPRASLVLDEAFRYLAMVEKEIA